MVYTYDSGGNLKTSTDSNGRKSVYSYDNNNRLESTAIYEDATATSPSKTITYSYNEAGSLTGYNDAVTSATYGYDDLQRRTSESVNYGSFTLSHGYGYSASGRKESYTDPAGRTRTFSYDKAGKILGIDLGATGQISYGSYNWTRPTRITLPGGSSLNVIYDGLLQPVSIVAKDPGENAVLDYSYDYSPSGNVTTKESEHGEYSYNYDELYRLTVTCLLPIVIFTKLTIVTFSVFYQIITAIWRRV